MFYQVAGPLMRLNGLIYMQFRAPRKGTIKVHLGPGQNNYLDGWVNVDANMFTGKCDVWADLRNRLPFHDASIDACYSHHVVEHLPDITHHLREVYRCLKPGGVYRLGGPNGDTAIAKFMAGDKNWFGDFPDSRNSIGGRFENFVFCRGEHLSILTFSMLEEFMISIGYSDIRLCLPVRETHYSDLYSECLAKESESDFNMPHTLIIEARKPDHA
jgi:SAM-dependent methyltransferase